MTTSPSVPARKNRLLMPAGLRRGVLVVHLAATLGWMGAAVAFIALDVTTMSSGDTAVVRACYIAMEVLLNSALFWLATLGFWSGIVMGLGTKWGLFRHWWVILTLVLTMVASAALNVMAFDVSDHADLARDAATTDAQLEALGHMLPWSVGGVVLLLAITAVNVYKPFGLTPYGRRKQAAAAPAA